MITQRVPVGEILTLKRRSIAVDVDAEYREIGIRSFGRGIFHKEPVSGLDLGNKRVFRIEPGDLVISNVFAWEGAIAVASDAEAGKIGSHRFMTFVPSDDRVDTSWAAWFFLSEPGLELIRKASPGSAGRNRTLAIDRFEALEIPLLPIDQQRQNAHRLNTFAASAQHLRQASQRSQEIALALLLSWLEQHFSMAGPSVALGDLAEVLRGRGPRYESETNARAINQACVRWGGIDLSRAREVEQSWWLAVPESGRVQPGDVLVNSTGDGTIGRAAVADSSAAGVPFDSHVLVIRCDESRLVPDYLAAYLRSPTGQAQVQAAKGANTTKQTELGKAKVERLKIPAPSMEVQHSFVLEYRSMLNKAKEIETILERRSDRIAALLPAAVNEAFADFN